jgi:hypothetical protein
MIDVLDIRYVRLVAAASPILTISLASFHLIPRCFVCGAQGQILRNSKRLKPEHAISAV